MDLLSMRITNGILPEFLAKCDLVHQKANNKIQRSCHPHGTNYAAAAGHGLLRALSLCLCGLCFCLCFLPLPLWPGFCMPVRVSSSPGDGCLSAVSIALAAVRIHGCMNNRSVVMQEAG